jgi:ankyrin repeat protein
MNNTPLHYACGYGRVGLVRMLLNGGADKTVQNNTGKMPLDLAK